MAEPLGFSNEWVVQIRAMLHNDDENSQTNGKEIGRAKADAILRVATPLLKKKPEAYIPQFLSIGPYHHSSLEKDIESSCAERKISTAEMYKARSAARLSQELRKNDKSFESIVGMMEHLRPKIERFYHWAPITDAENSQKFALMMAVDSSFLLHFLLFLSTRPGAGVASLGSDNDMVEISPLLECIKCDILKLENQIPLDVLKEVFVKIDGRDEKFVELLQKASKELSPFSVDKCNDDGKKPINDERHLLGCMRACVAPIIQIPSKNDKLDTATIWQILKFILDFPFMVLGFFLPTATFERRYEIALNADNLAKGQIKFKPSNKIHLEEYSGTLYLPEINIWETHTEVLLRNMVAMEFNDPSSGNTVMRYVSLMNCLIQTPEDVRVLRDCGVIRSNTDVDVIRDRRAVRTNMLTDECIAKMWNDLGQPFFTGYLGPDSDDLGQGLFDVLWEKDSKTKIKRMLWGLLDYLSSWKFLLPTAGFLVFAMTVIQTYCNLYALYHSPPSAPAHA